MLSLAHFVCLSNSIECCLVSFLMVVIAVTTICFASFTHCVSSYSSVLYQTALTRTVLALPSTSTRQKESVALPPRREEDRCLPMLVLSAHLELDRLTGCTWTLCRDPFRPVSHITPLLGRRVLVILFLIFYLDGSVSVCRIITFERLRCRYMKFKMCKFRCRRGF